MTSAEIFEDFAEATSLGSIGARHVLGVLGTRANGWHVNDVKRRTRYARENREAHNANSRRWYHANLEKARALARANKKRQYREDAEFRKRCQRRNSAYSKAHRELINEQRRRYLENPGAREAKRRRDREWARRMRLARRIAKGAA